MAIAGIVLDGSALTTTYIQNVAGEPGVTGFFFMGAWASAPETGIQNVKSGWTVVGNPAWVVTGTNEGDQTITITGGTFLSGIAYAFTGPSGLTIGGGVTITA